MDLYNTDADDGIEEWQTFYSKRAKREYYYHPGTRIVTWIKPDQTSAKHSATSNTTIRSLPVPAQLEVQVAKEAMNKTVPSKKASSFAWGQLLGPWLVLATVVLTVAILWKQQAGWTSVRLFVLGDTLPRRLSQHSETISWKRHSATIGSTKVGLQCGSIINPLDQIDCLENTDVRKSRARVQTPADEDHKYSGLVPNTSYDVVLE